LQQVEMPSLSKYYTQVKISLRHCQALNWLRLRIRETRGCKTIEHHQPLS
jgi:hypothetical protein